MATILDYLYSCCRCSSLSKIRRNTRYRESVVVLAEQFNLLEEQRNARLPSGRQ